MHQSVNICGKKKRRFNTDNTDYAFTDLHKNIYKMKKFQKENPITYKIIGCAYKIHSALGPGLLESSYEACLEYELKKNGLKVERQKALPLIYEEVHLETGYRIDLLVENKVIIEIKSVDAIAPIHEAQLLTYMKLSNIRVGLLINFNVPDLKQGIHRRVL